MKTNAPKQITWLISVIVGVLGLLANFGVIPQLAPFSFWMVTFGFVVLALATILEGL